MNDFVSRRRLGALSTAMALALGLSMPASVNAQEEQNYLLATASTGGTYYPVGVALATLVKVKLQPKDKIGMSAINSAGSGENIKLLADNEAQFAILQGLFGAYAATGTGPLEGSGPQEDLRSISMLWSNVEHFIVSADAVETGTLADLANVTGKGAALGAQNSGTLGSNETILTNLGYDVGADFEMFFAGYTPSVEAFRDGKVDFVSTPAGVPVSAVTQLFATKLADEFRVLDVTDEEMVEANGSFDELWTRYVIEAETYPAQTEPINTIAQPNFLSVRADVPEETVYLITKTIFENLPFLQAIHPATKAMAVDKAIAGLPLKLHPGAIRYYEEAGIEIPDRLK